MVTLCRKTFHHLGQFTKLDEEGDKSRIDVSDDDGSGERRRDEDRILFILGVSL